MYTYRERIILFLSIVYFPGGIYKVSNSILVVAFFHACLLRSQSIHPFPPFFPSFLFFLFFFVIIYITLFGDLGRSGRGGLHGSLPLTWMLGFGIAHGDPVDFPHMDWIGWIGGFGEGKWDTE